MLSRPLRRKRQKLSDVIVESVKRSIVTDALKPGDRLPTERELMESFQCSKGSASARCVISQPPTQARLFTTTLGFIMRSRASV